MDDFDEGWDSDGSLGILNFLVNDDDDIFERNILEETQSNKQFENILFDDGSVPSLVESHSKQEYSTKLIVVNEDNSISNATNKSFIGQVTISKTTATHFLNEQENLDVTFTFPKHSGDEKDLKNNEKCSTDEDPFFSACDLQQKLSYPTSGVNSPKYSSTPNFIYNLDEDFLKKMPCVQTSSPINGLNKENTKEQENLDATVIFSKHSGDVNDLKNNEKCSTDKDIYFSACDLQQKGSHPTSGVNSPKYFSTPNFMYNLDEDFLKEMSCVPTSSPISGVNKENTKEQENLDATLIFSKHSGDVNDLKNNERCSTDEDPFFSSCDLLQKLSHPTSGVNSPKYSSTPNFNDDQPRLDEDFLKKMSPGHTSSPINDLNKTIVITGNIVKKITEVSAKRDSVKQNFDITHGVRDFLGTSLSELNKTFDIDGHDLKTFEELQNNNQTFTEGNVECQSDENIQYSHSSYSFVEENLSHQDYKNTSSNDLNTTISISKELKDESEDFNFEEEKCMLEKRNLNTTYKKIPTLKKAVKSSEVPRQQIIKKIGNVKIAKEIFPTPSSSVIASCSRYSEQDKMGVTKSEGVSSKKDFKTVQMKPKVKKPTVESISLEIGNSVTSKSNKSSSKNVIERPARSSSFDENQPKQKKKIRKSLSSISDLKKNDAENPKIPSVKPSYKIGPRSSSRHSEHHKEVKKTEGVSSEKLSGFPAIQVTSRKCGTIKEGNLEVVKSSSKNQSKQKKEFVWRESVHSIPHCSTIDAENHKADSVKQISSSSKALYSVGTQMKFTLPELEAKQVLAPKNRADEYLTVKQILGGTSDASAMTIEPAVRSKIPKPSFRRQKKETEESSKLPGPGKKSPKQKSPNPKNLRLSRCVSKTLR